jgi:hypothetical protein
MTSGRLDVEKLFAARLYATRVRPYLATALFALHTVESRLVPTMAVDRYWRCYVSPTFVARTPVEELAGDSDGRRRRMRKTTAPRAGNAPKIAASIKNHPGLKSSSGPSWPCTEVPGLS